MVMRCSQDGETSAWTGRGAEPILLVPGAGGSPRIHEPDEVAQGMVRVLVIGDHDVTTAPVRHALARVTGVEVLDRPVPRSEPEVDAVVIEGSLGSMRVAEGLQALVTLCPGASLVVVSLDQGDEYRWVHVQPHGAGFRVYDAGIGLLPAILVESLGRADTGNAVKRHATVPAIPCSMA
jgi:hypothetical protein